MKDEGSHFPFSISKFSFAILCLTTGLLLSSLLIANNQ
jgi:hypothetical protein